LKIAIKFDYSEMLFDSVTAMKIMEFIENGFKMDTKGYGKDKVWFPHKEQATGITVEFVNDSQIVLGDEAKLTAIEKEIESKEASLKYRKDELKETSTALDLTREQLSTAKADLECTLTQIPTAVKEEVEERDVPPSDD
jgi:hypothetical protein